MKAMNRPNLVITALLTAALLLLVSADWAQQPPGGAKQQPPAAPAAPNQQANPQSGQTFRTEVNLVDVLFTVLNRRNKLVPTWSRETSKFSTKASRRTFVISASRRICPCASGCCSTLPTAFATASSSNKMLRSVFFLACCAAIKTKRS